MSYYTFTRTWWRYNPSWPNGLEPEAGEPTYHDEYETEAEAREACHDFNSTHEPGSLSLKMEYDEGKLPKNPPKMLKGYTKDCI